MILKVIYNELGKQVKLIKNPVYICLVKLCSYTFPLPSFIHTSEYENNNCPHW